MPADLQKARDLFLHAVGKLPPEEWNRYVGEACGEDAELAQQVGQLLQVHREVGSFLDRPATAVGATRAFASVPGEEGAAVPLSECPGTIIGPYKLLQQIGEGGMGTVFMAEQTQPVQRKVAIKVIKPGMDSRQVIGRFEAERQALAMMDHVNIARVFEAGATDAGRPYFVMELVHGVPITRYCDDNHLTLRERLELFVPVCQAIQHAHQKGIIHRDVKPSNVMITLYDGKPVPKVIDFGVAKATEQKLTERTLFTHYGTMIGTLEYMSPEQAEMSALGVDTRSDIYSLGVLLYELLTGSTPLTCNRLKEAAYAEILRMIKEEEPPRPSTRLSDSGEALASISAQRKTEPAKLSRLMRGELDWIVMKTLEKDRNRRYETANGLARDIECYLADEPVQACPPSTMYRLRKFARRNKAGLVLLTVSGLALASVATLAILWYRAESLSADNRALSAEESAAQKGNELAIELRHGEELRELLVRAETAEATAKRQVKTIGRSQFALQLAFVAATYESDPDLGLRRLHDERYCPPDLRDFTWRLFDRLCQRQSLALRGHQGDVVGVVFAPDGQVLATAGTDGAVRLWDAASGEELAKLAGHTGAVLAVAFAPDGKLLASAGQDGTVRLWDVAARKQRFVLTGHSAAVHSVAFSADGGDLVSAGLDKSVIVWDAATAMQRSTLTGVEAPVFALSLVHGNRVLASATGRDVKLRDLESGKERVLTGHGDRVTSLAFDRDGKRLASTGSAYDKTVRLWDVADGRELAVLRGHKEVVEAVALAGDMVASAAGEETNRPTEVRLWDIRTGQTRTILKVPIERIRALTFSPDGQTLVTAGAGPLGGASQVIVWNVAPEPERATLKWNKYGLTHAVFAPDGKTLAASGSGGVQLWDVASGRPGSTFKYEGLVWSAVFTPDGKTLLSGGSSGTSPAGSAIHVWDVATGKLRTTLPVNAATIWGVACSPDGKTWAAATLMGELKVWLAATAKEAWSAQESPDKFKLNCLAYSADSATLATGSRGKTVTLWDVATGKLRATLQGHKGEVNCVAFSPDGKLLASASSDHTVKLWDLATLTELFTLTGHTGSVQSVTFSPNGRTLATGGWDKSVKLWDPVAGVEQATFQRHLGAVSCVAFDRDGDTLASASVDATVKIWDATTRRGTEKARPK
jgi:WD40 repeat protein/serine/threonine protein kinase